MKNTLAKNVIIAIRVTLVTMVVTGIIYPVAVTALAQAIFPGRAGGSLVAGADGTAVGSGLIGQPFAQARYLRPRPSAAGNGYDANASSGSNLGPTSPKLKERAQAEIARLVKENPAAPLPVPVELVTTSASGLDPHLSPEGALWQAERIASARGVAPERVRALLMDMVEGPTLGFIGEPRINVLTANLAMDRQLGAKQR